MQVREVKDECGKEVKKNKYFGCAYSQVNNNNC